MTAAGAGFYTPPARVTKLQVLVTSYRRPLYLDHCLASLRQCDIDLYAVDGGDRDEETTRILNTYCDLWLGLKGNPGADVLRNAGLQAFITDPVCLFSSDDYMYPAEWAGDLLEQWYSLQTCQNMGGAKWGAIACPPERFVEDHASSFEAIAGTLFSPRKTLPVYSFEGASGLLLDTALLRRVGGFPVYGRFGAGRIALSLELKSRRLLGGYDTDPVVIHLGASDGRPARVDEYPEHIERRAADGAVWQARAAAHKPGERSGFLWSTDLPGDAL